MVAVSITERARLTLSNSRFTLRESHKTGRSDYRIPSVLLTLRSYSGYWRRHEGFGGGNGLDLEAGFIDTYCFHLLHSPFHIYTRVSSSPLNRSRSSGCVSGPAIAKPGACVSRAEAQSLRRPLSILHWSIPPDCKRPHHLFSFRYSKRPCSSSLLSLGAGLHSRLASLTFGSR